MVDIDECPKIPENNLHVEDFFREAEPFDLILQKKIADFKSDKYKLIGAKKTFEHKYFITLFFIYFNHCIENKFR